VTLALLSASVLEVRFTNGPRKPLGGDDVVVRKEDSDTVNGCKLFSRYFVSPVDREFRVFVRASIREGREGRRGNAGANSNQVGIACGSKEALIKRRWTVNSPLISVVKTIYQKLWLVAWKSDVEEGRCRRWALAEK